MSFLRHGCRNNLEVLRLCVCVCAMSVELSKRRKKLRNTTSKNHTPKARTYFKNSLHVAPRVPLLYKWPLLRCSSFESRIFVSLVCLCVCVAARGRTYIRTHYFQKLVRFCVAVDCRSLFFFFFFFSSQIPIIHKYFCAVTHPHLGHY